MGVYTEIYVMIFFFYPSLSFVYDEIEVFPLNVYDVQLTKTGGVSDFGEPRDPPPYLTSPNLPRSRP